MINKNIKQVFETYQIIVTGGGPAGFSAAIAAARHGRKTCLVSDRPVLGGNTSSEIRVTPHGAAAFHAYGREGGVFSEALTQDPVENYKTVAEDGGTNSIWDMILYDMAIRTKNLTLRLDASVYAVKMSNHKIKAVMAGVDRAETKLTLYGKQFIDCTGDGTIAALAGCQFDFGADSHDKYQEPHARLKHVSPKQNKTMGSTLTFQAVDSGQPIKFRLPSWAIKINNPEFFYAQGRDSGLKKFSWKKSGFWWIELATPWNTIYDNEKLRHELTRWLYGIWNYMKNVDPHLKQITKNYTLDWISQVPGKRESRRIKGLTILTEKDILGRRVFYDEIGYGGWNIDSHNIRGLLSHSRLATDPQLIEGTKFGASTYIKPYGIPLGSLIAKGVDNLFLAGRDISASHLAMASSRVAGTCAILGQAAGTAASVAIRHRVNSKDVDQNYIFEVQQSLLADEAFLPHVKNSDKNDLAKKAQVSASSCERLVGTGPNSPSRLGRLGNWPQGAHLPKNGRLTQKNAQLVCLGDKQDLKQIALAFSNQKAVSTQVPVSLYLVSDIWDYHFITNNSPLLTQNLTVPSGGPWWANLNLKNLDKHKLPKDKYLAIVAGINKNVIWHISPDVSPGNVALYEAYPKKFQRFCDGNSLSFWLSPAQNCYRPQNILSGVNRPQTKTNVWRSDPKTPLPQWLELTWKTPQKIKQLQIIFEGGQLRDYIAQPAFYKDPQVTAKYNLQIKMSGHWQTVVSVSENYQERNVFTFDSPLITDKIRLVISTTNGDASAGIYEIRAYQTKKLTPISFPPKIHWYSGFSGK